MKKQVSIVILVIMLVCSGNLFAQQFQGRSSGQVLGNVLNKVGIPKDIMEVFNPGTFGGLRAGINNSEIYEKLPEKAKQPLTRLAVMSRITRDEQILTGFAKNQKTIIGSVEDISKLSTTDLVRQFSGDLQDPSQMEKALRLKNSAQQYLQAKEKFHTGIGVFFPTHPSILSAHGITTGQELREQVFAKEVPIWITQVGEEKLEHFSYLDLITQGSAGFKFLAEKLKEKNIRISSIPELLVVKDPALSRALYQEMTENEFLNMQQRVDESLNDFSNRVLQLQADSDCQRYPALCPSAEPSIPPSTEPCITCDDMADRMSPVGYLQALQAYVQRSYPTIFRPDADGEPKQQDFEKRFVQSFTDLSTQQGLEHEQSYVKFTNHVLENLISQRGNQRWPNRLPITLEDRIASHLVKDAIYQTLQSPQEDEKKGLLFSLLRKFRQEFGLTDEEIENLTQLEKLGNQKLKKDYEQQLVKDSNQFLSTQERTIQLLNIQGQNTSTTLIGLPPIGRIPEQGALKAWDVPQQAKAWAMNQTTLFGLTKEGTILARSLLNDGSWAAISSDSKGRDILMQVADDSTADFSAAGGLLVVALENKLYWGRIPELLELGSITWKEIPHTHTFSQITSIAIWVSSDSSASQLYVVDQHQHFWRAPLPLAPDPDTGLEFFNSLPSLSNNTDSFDLIVRTNGEGYAWNPDTKILQKLSSNFIPPPITRGPVQGTFIPQTPHRDPVQGTFTPQSGQSGSGSGVLAPQPFQAGPTAGNDGVSNTQETSTTGSWTLDQTIQSVFGVGSRLLVLKDESDLELLQTKNNKPSWSTIAQIQANLKEGLAGKETDILWREWIADRTVLLQEEFQQHLDDIRLKKAKEFATKEYIACSQSKKPECKSGNIEEILENFQSLAYQCFEGEAGSSRSTKCSAGISRIEPIEELLKKYAKSYPGFQQDQTDEEQEAAKKFAERKVQALRARISIEQVLGRHLRYKAPPKLKLSKLVSVTVKPYLVEGPLQDGLKDVLNDDDKIPDIKGEAVLVRWDDPLLPYQQDPDPLSWVLIEKTPNPTDKGEELNSTEAETQSKKEGKFRLLEIREEAGDIYVYQVVVTELASTVKPYLQEGPLQDGLKDALNADTNIPEIQGEAVLVRWDEPLLPYQHGEVQPTWILVEKRNDPQDTADQNETDTEEEQKSEAKLALLEIRAVGNEFNVYQVAINDSGNPSLSEVYYKHEDEFTGFSTGELNQQIHLLAARMCEGEVKQSAFKLQTLYTEIHQRTEQAWRPIIARVESEQLSQVRGLLVKALVDEEAQNNDPPDPAVLWKVTLTLKIGETTKEIPFSDPVSNVNDLEPFKQSSKKFPVSISKITINQGIWQLCDEAQFLGNCKSFKNGQILQDVALDGTFNSEGRIFGSYKDLIKFGGKKTGTGQKGTERESWVTQIASFRPHLPFSTNPTTPDPPQEDSLPIAKFANSKELGKYLYLDLETSEDVTTSELVFATQRLQSLVQSFQLGEDVVLPKTEQFDEQEWKWMQQYAGWKAREMVRRYPENYLFPSIRPNPSPNFETFAKTVSDNAGQDVEEVLDDFVTDVERHAEISVWDTVTMEDRMVAFGRFFDGRSREVFYSIHHENGQWKGWRPIAEFPDYEWRPHTNRQELFHLLYGALTSTKKNIHLFTFQPSLVPVAGEELWDLKYITLKFDAEEILRASGEWIRIEGVEAQAPQTHPVALTRASPQGQPLEGQGSGTINVWQVRPENQKMQVWELNVDPRKEKLGLQASRIVESNFYGGTTGLMGDANGSHLIWKQDKPIPAVKPAVGLESRWWGNGKKWGENKTENGQIPPKVSTEHKRYKTAPDLAQSTNGHYVLVWSDNEEVLIRGFDASGKQRFATQVADGNSPKVSMDRNGDFVVLWKNLKADKKLSPLLFQTFNASGNPNISNPKPVYTLEDNYIAGDGDVAMTANGRIVVNWVMWKEKDLVCDFTALSLAAALAATKAAANPTEANVAAAKAAIEAVNDCSFSGPKVLLKSFWRDGTGQTPGKATLVKGYLANEDSDKFMPISTIEANNNYVVVVWQDDQGSNGKWNVSMNGYLWKNQAEFIPVFDDVKVNNETDDHQMLPAVALADDGHFVVVFEHRHKLDKPKQRDILIRGFDIAEIPPNRDSGSIEIRHFEWFSERLAHNQKKDDKDVDGFQFAPQVAMGGPPQDPHQFVVVFQDEPGSEEEDDPGIKIRTFNGEGTPIEESEQLLISSDGEMNQYLPTVVLDPFLGMVVAWQAAEPTTGDDEDPVTVDGQIMSKSFKPTFHADEERTFDQAKGHFLISAPTTTGNLPPFSNPDLTTFSLEATNNQIFVGGKLLEYAGLQITTTSLPLQVIHRPDLLFAIELFKVAPDITTHGRKPDTRILGVSTRTVGGGVNEREGTKLSRDIYALSQAVDNRTEIEISQKTRTPFEWHLLNQSTARADQVLIGDFDGNGKANDVFGAWGGKWYVSYRGTSQWKRINGAAATVDRLRVGDFNGDSISDLLTKNRSSITWKVSYGGTSKFEEIGKDLPRETILDVDNLKLADLNGDGCTDILGIFKETKGGLRSVPRGKIFLWKNSTGEKCQKNGTNNWMELAIERTNGFSLSEIHIGDFDGKEGDDLYLTYANDKDGEIEGGRISFVRWDDASKKFIVSQPKKVNQSPAKATEILIADINGDKKSDVIYSTNGKVLGLYSGSGRGFPLNLKAGALSQYRIGSFNTSSPSDVFNSWGGNWFYLPIQSFGGDKEGNPLWKLVETIPDTNGKVSVGVFNDQIAVIQRDGRRWQTAPFARPYELLTTIPLKADGEFHDPSVFQNAPRKLTLLPSDLRLPRRDALYEEVGSDDFVRVYLDEYFLHLPMLYGTELSQQGQFEQAKQWLSKVYDPLAPEGETKTSRALEFPTHSPSEADQLNPFPRADQDKIRYLIATKLAHIRNDAEWANRLFVQDTRESVNRSRGLYTLVQTILGQPSPVRLACGVQDSPGTLVNRFEWSSPNRILAQNLVTISQSSSNDIKEKLAQLAEEPACVPIQQAAVGQIAREETTSRFSTVGPIFKRKVGSEKEDSRTFMERVKEDDLCRDGMCIINEKESQSLPYIPSPYTAQCFSGNPQIEELAQKIEVNLTRIRAGQNYVGMERRLPLRVENIDPGSLLLQQAQNGEVDFGSLSLSGPPPRFRYRFLWDRAKYLADQAEQLQHTLLSTLEKKDAARYSLFRARQDMRLEAAQLSTQGLRVQEGRTGVEMAGAQESRAGFQQRHFQKLINNGPLGYERAALAFKIAAGAARAASASASGFSFTKTVDSFGLSIEGAGQQVAAAVADTSATIYDTKASWKRRKQDWKFQRNLAEKDLQISKIGVDSAWNQLAILEKEYDNAALRVRIAQDTVEFLGNQFTGAPLYAWMEGKIRELYRDQLNRAIATARTAQHALAFELQLPLNQITVNYWDDERQQLIGAARLKGDLEKLNTIRVESLTRKKELEKTISLAALAPIAFEEFKQTGLLNFDTPLRLFQQDFPSHYFRILRDVDVSVFALIPPNQGIHATLSNSGISRVLKGPPLKDPTIIQRAPESIALSSFVNDNGLFELRPQDPLLYPFEGGGVATEWELAMPKGANRFDYRTIADVYLTIRYTALEDRSLGQEVLREIFNKGPDGLVETEQLRFVSLRQEFPDMWYALNNPRFLALEKCDPNDREDTCEEPEEEVLKKWPYALSSVLSCEGPLPRNKGPKPYQVFFELGRDHFLPNEERRRLKSVKMAVVKNDGRFESDKTIRDASSEWSLEYIPDSCVPDRLGPLPLDVASQSLTVSQAWRDVVGTAPYGKWVVTLHPEKVSHDLRKPVAQQSALAKDLGWQDLDLSWLEDVVLLLEYEAKTQYD